MPDQNGIQPRQFRYTLNVRGVDTYVLPNAPIGWDESLIKWSRSPIYHGMMRTFTVPMKFVLDGAWILRTEFYTYGIRGNVQIWIEELDPATWRYETRYLGDVDFSTFDDIFDEDAFYVNVTIMEAGLSAMVKAYEGVKYEIPIDVPEAIDIEITPLILQETATFIFESEVTQPQADVFPGLELVSNETQSTVASVQSVEKQQTSSPNYATSDRWFFKATINTDVIITDGFFKGGILALFASGKALSILLKKSDGSTVSTLYSHLVTSSAENFNFQFNFNLTVPLLAGEKLFIYEEISGGTVTTGGFITYEGQFSASYSTQSPPTMCKALRPAYVFTQLIQKMNNDVAYPVQSSLLEAMEQVTITSTEAIRQILNPKIKTSFSDFFQAFWSITECGFGLEGGRAVFEEFAYFFRKDMLAANVGNVKSFGLTPYEPFLYSSVKVGYPEQQFTTILNGRDEINSTQEWTLPITRVQKELNLVSTYRADPYGIEDIRITLLDKNTTNNANDNDVFLIKVKEAPEIGQTYYHPERSEGYISIKKTNGSPMANGDSLYNWDLTPKRNLIRHSRFLHSVLDKYDGYQIKFASALGNTDVVVIDNNGVRVQENENIEISTLGDKIFLPYLITTVTKLPVDMLALMDAFPTGYIRCVYMGGNLDGFIIDASVDISRNSEREFKELLTANNNLQNLIH